MLGGPLSHVMAAKAVALAEARQPSFAAYAHAIADNARGSRRRAAARGAALVTGGTDNHIVLLDVGPRSGSPGGRQNRRCWTSSVVTNRNSIPADPNGAWYTSGIRLGTPALTTRGFGPDDFDRVAELIVDVLSNTDPAVGTAGPSKAKYKLADGTADRVHAAARELLDTNPLYPGLTL